MKEVFNQIRQRLMPLTIVTIFLVSISGSTFAQKGIGAKYAARDPRTCADTKSPVSGAISAAQATKYVICNQERQFGDDLYLVDKVTVSIGGSRRYNSFTDSNATSIDTTAPVYPIRGSFDKYQCTTISTLFPNNGKNCTLYHEPKSEGKCFKTTFGEWYCNMEDLDNNQSDREYNLPPPGSSTAAPDNNKTAAQNDNQTAETKADTDENGFPAPDFSEMEKYYDISKIEYDVADGKLYFIGKMTKKNNAVNWKIDFYDADGIKVIDTNGIDIASGDYHNPGDLARYFFYLPPESMMKRVKKVVITRKIV